MRDNHGYHPVKRRKQYGGERRDERDVSGTDWFRKEKYKPQDQWGTGQSYADRTGAYNV